MGYRLYRSRRDRMLAGVAGGLAEMWGADPSFVRIIWALLVVFTGGVALLVYIVMAIVVPEEDVVFGPGGAPPRSAGTAPPTFERGAGWGAPRASGGGLPPGVLLGGFFILIGAFFLAREFLPRIDLDWVGPLALVGVGALLIVSALGRGPRFGGPPAAPPAAPPPSDAPPPSTPPTSET